MTEQRLFSNQRLIRLIIPLVIEQALTILVGMCDGVMVSSVGEAAISGVSLVDMINNVILVLFAALATGGAVVTSQFLAAEAGFESPAERRSAGADVGSPWCRRGGAVPCVRQKSDAAVFWFHR
mgnify:CR=1 FL=1